MKILFGFGLAAILAVSGIASDWAQFRGPDFGTSKETGFPMEWSGSKNIVWKTELPGAGASCPVVLDGKIYLTSYSGYNPKKGDKKGDKEKLVYHVLCFDGKSGKKLWEKTFKPKTEILGDPKGFFELHGYSSSTPAVDKDGVFTVFNGTDAYALSLDGKEMWNAVIQEMSHKWCGGSSPVIYKNMVIFVSSDDIGSMKAFDKRTGKQVWSDNDIPRAWSTPVLTEINGKTQLILNMKKSIAGFDPENGKKIWNASGVDDYICPTPIVNESIIYFVAGRSRTAKAIKIEGDKAITLWTTAKGSNVVSPVFNGGFLFFAREDGKFFTCLDAKTGKVMYDASDPDENPEGDDVLLRIYTSPVAVDGRIYYVRRNGSCIVLPAKPEFKILAKNNVNDGAISNASLVPNNKQFLFRNNKYLYCIGQK